MTQLTIKSNLEANRVSELKSLLNKASDRIVEYVAEAGKPGSSIGPKIEPKDLSKILEVQLPEDGKGEAGFLKVMDQILENSVVTWHPGFLDKLYASNNPVGVGADLLLSVLNTNSHVYTVSPALSIIEKEISHKYAQLFGFTGTHSGGLTFPGGSASNATSVTVARSMLYPDTKLHGNGTYKFALFSSEHSHYSVEKAAIFCGMGSNALFKVKVDNNGAMIPTNLEEAILKAKSEGYTPLYVNATAGTTVYGSYDPFEEISKIAKKHGIWLHIDGSWGGNIVFSKKQAHKLKGVELANSITVNPHKMLGVPCTCSFLLLPDERVLQQSNSLNAPYLFHNSTNKDENYDLADGTMLCGRRSDALKLYLGFLWYGRKGYEDRVDHAFEIAEYFCTSIESRKGFTLISSNPPPCLQVCFFYSPSGDLSASKEENTRITRTIAHDLHSSGQFLVDYAPEAGEQSRGEFFRVVFNSPILTSDTIDQLISAIEKAGSK